jgi:hypothetical protein
MLGQAAQALHHRCEERQRLGGWLRSCFVISSYLDADDLSCVDVKPLKNDLQLSSAATRSCDVAELGEGCVMVYLVVERPGRIVAETKNRRMAEMVLGADVPRMHLGI